MRVAVIGAGYVGLIQAVGLAHIGHDVVLAERDAERVAAISAGRSPIYEPGLPELLSAALANKSLTVTTSNIDAVEGAEIVFLALPTPQGNEGEADVSAIFLVADELAPVLPVGCLVVTKSTVPVGTNLEVGVRTGRPVASNPEFLREGSAVTDFMKPDRIVIGAQDRSYVDKLVELYRPIDAPILVTDLVSAEVIKYAANGYLAARVTYANAMANVCEAVGADVRDVLLGIGYDHRIGFSFMRPGPGFGGSCFPKDTRALVKLAADAGYEFSLMRGVIATNEEQLARTFAKVEAAAGGNVRGSRVAVWGLAFKAGTDDVRESPALAIVGRLVDAGADVVAFDPQASVPGVAAAPDAMAAVDHADVLLIATEWPQFQRCDLQAVAARMRGSAIVDARNLLDPTAVKAAGLTYTGVGR